MTEEYASLVDRMKKSQEEFNKEYIEIIKSFPTLSKEDRDNLDKDHLILGTCMVRYDGDTLKRVPPCEYPSLDTISYFTR